MNIGTSVRDSSGKFEIEVLVNGAPQPLYRRRFDGKPFVTGAPGESYTLRVRNLTGDRLEIVNSIDQRDTLGDQPASLTNRGLIVNAHGTTSFDGWRHNDDQVGRFVFGQPDHSIAAQATGDTSSVGIIGFAAFTEQPTRFFGGAHGGGLESMQYRGAPETFGAGASKGATRGGLGTGIGATVDSHVQRVSFTRSSAPASILEVGYDTEQWLRENGLLAPAEPVAFPTPQAFGAYQHMS